MNDQYQFPDLSHTYTVALEDDPVLLDGQRVLFDKKVTLMPVELEKKTETNES